MEVTAYNPQKGRVETIEALFTEDNTTWFNSTRNPNSIRMITDLNDNLLITDNSRKYPVIIYDLSRKSINYSSEKAGKLFKQALSES
ncbi:MAG: hypothetical protein KJ630_18590 [Proteobacteria bacterium]|nr:hypothetical protein [Pseudomonadota bacterium]